MALFPPYATGNGGPCEWLLIQSNYQGHTLLLWSHTLMCLSAAVKWESSSTHTSGFHVSARFDCVVQVAWVRVCLSLPSKLPFWIVHRERPAFVPTANSARGAFTIQLQFPLQFWQYSWHLMSMVNPSLYTKNTVKSYNKNPESRSTGDVH